MELVRVIEALQQVRTPLMLSGLVAVLMFLLYKGVLRELRGDRGALRTLSGRMITALFWLALAAILLGFAGYLVSLPPVETPASVYGKVFRRGDLTTGVGGARVFLEQEDLKSETTDSTGHFVFALVADRLGRSARIWAEADGYVPADPFNILLVRGMDGVMIGLEPLPEIPAEILEKARPEKQLRKLSRGRITRRLEFDYPVGPYPGRRSWLQSPDGSWLEVFPNGLFAIYRPAGETTLDSCTGAIVRNLDNPWFEVFVPVPGCAKPWLRFRQHDGNWEYLAAISEE